MVEVVLGDKGFQHFGQSRPFTMLRKEAAVAQMAAPADHGEVDCDHPCGFGDGHHVGIGLAAGGIDELFFAHCRQHAKAVAQVGGSLEIEHGRSSVHLPGDGFGQSCGFSVQQLGGFVDVARVGFSRYSLTHGAVQRLIWCSRQGRERLANTASSQVRN